MIRSVFVLYPPIVAQIFRVPARRGVSVLPMSPEPKRRLRSGAVFWLSPAPRANSFTCFRGATPLFRSDAPLNRRYQTNLKYWRAWRTRLN